MASREGGGAAAAAAAAAARPALRVGWTREYRTGMETELLSIDAAAAAPAVSLFVLCGDRFDDAQLFRSGALSLHMARVEGHPVSMASCTVADHQWMLARDALVARVDKRAFVFELPGFFYAVVVPPDATGGADRKCATMADIFSRFCAYHDLAATDGGDEPGGGELNPNPWVRAHTRIQRLKRHTSPAAAGQAAADAPSDRAKQMERAVRTSAVVKLLTRSLLAGVLQPARHLTITIGGGGGVNAGTSSRGASAALPSKSVVSDLLDAIETNRAASRRDPRRGSGGSGGGLGWWNLNVEGVMLLLRVVQAVRGRKHLAAPAAGEKRPRDGGPGRDSTRGGVMGGGGAAFGSASARRWCGGRSRKLGNTVGACGSS